MNTQLLTGFQEWHPAEFAARRQIFETWRRVCRAHAFIEYDGPVLEPAALYRKKSGGELVGQLFAFTDQGGEEVALRPEMTPTLARMVAARQAQMRKPLKWFSIAPFFRYERPQKGRRREFTQLNCDLFGEAAGPVADAEVIALAAALPRAFGLGAGDFTIRISDRGLWPAFLAARGVDAARTDEFLAIVDKVERAPAVETDAKLAALGLDGGGVRAFLAADPAEALPSLGALREELRARGLGDVARLDPTIVRGLAYYTGMVFEIFGPTGRAVAGGGRYDGLIATLTDGAANLPAVGFAIGDVTFTDLLRASPAASARLEAAAREDLAPRVYGVIADEARRADGVRLFAALRAAGVSVDYPLGPMKVGKQFGAAEQLGAKFAVVVGGEWPEVKVKALATREERAVPGTPEAVLAAVSQ